MAIVAYKNDKRTLIVVLLPPEFRPVVLNHTLLFRVLLKHSQQNEHEVTKVKVLFLEVNMTLEFIFLL